jgi:hypothetical protein
MTQNNAYRYDIRDRNQRNFRDDNFLLTIGLVGVDIVNKSRAEVKSDDEANMTTALH